MRDIKTDLEMLHLYNVYIPDSTIYLGSHSGSDDGEDAGVDFMMAENLIKNLHVIDKIMHPDGITIKMNNPGGDVYHGMAIYDAIKACKNRVKIEAYGYVMSMGSVILQAADERVMSPSCRMMIHYGQSSMAGHLKDIYKETEELKKLDSIINTIYLKRIKQIKPRYTMRKLEEAMKFNWYLGAEEAIKMGLCDLVL